jgi:hypothetical protein
MCSLEIDSLFDKLSTFPESRSCAHSTSKPIRFLKSYCPLIIEAGFSLSLSLILICNEDLQYIYELYV